MLAFFKFGRTDGVSALNARHEQNMTFFTKYYSWDAIRIIGEQRSGFMSRVHHYLRFTRRDGILSERH